MTRIGRYARGEKLADVRIGGVYVTGSDVRGSRREILVRVTGSRRINVGGKNLLRFVVVDLETGRRLHQPRPARSLRRNWAPGPPIL